MEEIKVKNNTLGLKVYTIGEPQTSGEEYDLLVSSFLDGLEKLKERETCPLNDLLVSKTSHASLPREAKRYTKVTLKSHAKILYLYQRQAHASLSRGAKRYIEVT